MKVRAAGAFDKAGGASQYCALDVTVLAMIKVSAQELHQLAESGDAQAQYALAAMLSNAGRGDEAERWLKEAADQGDADALYTMATREMNGADGVAKSLDQLRTAASNGSTAGQRLLGAFHAIGLGVERDWPKATGFVVQAAKAGDAAAMRELALLLFAYDPSDQDGVTLLEVALTSDPVAGAVYVRRAVAGGQVDKALAESALRKLEAVKYPHALSLRRALGSGDATETESKRSPDWGRITENLKREPVMPEAAAEALCEQPSAQIIRRAFTPEECEYVIAVGADLLSPSQIIDPVTGEARPDDYRTSLTATLGPVDFDLALLMINYRLSSLTGVPYSQGEFLSVLYYTPGEEYRPHFDWLPQGNELERSGQRTATALLYLNDTYEGGETHFLTPDIRFKGEPGDVLVFRNATSDGEIDQSSQHAGLPVRSGGKWLASKWFREKDYRF